VDLFKPVLTSLLGAMGESPAAFCHDLQRRVDLRPFAGRVYRFNLGSDMACLAWACGEALRQYGSLEALFANGLHGASDEAWREALAGFTGYLRGRDFSAVHQRLGPPRALDHLLPRAELGGACKRLHLYLRWMVRPADGVDLGVWGLSPARLCVPLDTHLGRMARNLGLTRRRDLGIRTAQEITQSLRRIDPEDPVRYDFALCHFGMSGRCPARRTAARCGRCALRTRCLAGTRTLRLHPVGSGARENELVSLAPSRVSF